MKQTATREPVPSFALPADRLVPQYTVPGARIDLYRKHSLAIRWMHWINFPLLFTMIWSGLLIYWADSIPNVGHLSQVYRIGIGHWTVFRLFPRSWYHALGMDGRLTTGLGFHFLFMWLFALNGLAYVSYLVLSGEWRTLAPQRGALRDAWRVLLFDLHLRRSEPRSAKYNAAQKIAYSVVLLMAAGSLLTGLAIYKPTSAHWLTTSLGGYEMARWEHFWLTMGFCAFFLIHVFQVVMAGWKNFNSMITGYELNPADESGTESG